MSSLSVLGISDKVESYDEAVHAWHHLDGMRDDLNWTYGALVSLVAVKYGEGTLDKYAKDVGRTASALRMYRRVFEDQNENRFSFSSLKWVMFLVAQALPREERPKVLAMAEKNGWKKRDLERHIRETYRRDTPPMPSGRFSVVVADPPWAYDEGWPEYADEAGSGGPRIDLPYDSMTVDEIKELPVPSGESAHLFLWTTNRYLRDSYDVAEAWGFRPSQVLVWCKPPMGIGPGGVFSNTAEFVLYGLKGSTSYKTRTDSTWWQWPRGIHSAKPEPFQDLIEQMLEGPYLEMFARRQRPGWTCWGLEATSELDRRGTRGRGVVSDVVEG